MGAIIIAEPFALLRTALHAHIEARYPGEVYDVENAQQLVEAVKKWKPQVIVFDPVLATLSADSLDFLNCGPSNGAEPRKSVSQESPCEILLTCIQNASPKTRVLILTDNARLAEHRSLLLHGASGLVLKERPMEALLQAIERVRNGEIWIERNMMADFMADVWHQRRAKQEIGVETLTRREKEIAALIGKGLRNKQIAAELYLSETTVRHHLTSIYDKLGIRGRQELLLFALKNNLSP
jgi:DNA-binding NarL/FixJ family response regulator